MPALKREEWDTLPSDLVPLSQVPQGGPKREFSERLMSFESAVRAFNLKVHGAKQLEGRWVVFFEYDKPEVGPQKRWFILKKAMGDELYTTIEVGPWRFQDVCVESYLS